MDRIEKLAMEAVGREAVMLYSLSMAESRMASERPKDVIANWLSRGAKEEDLPQMITNYALLIANQQKLLMNVIEICKDRNMAHLNVFITHALAASNKNNLENVPVWDRDWETRRA